MAAFEEGTVNALGVGGGNDTDESRKGVNAQREKRKPEFRKYQK